MSLEGIRVCMFVRNAFEHDARVEREARTLAGAGAEVTVVALWDADRTPRRETRGPITVRRVSRWFWVVDKLRAAWVRRARPEGGAPEPGAVTAGLNALQRSWTGVRRVGAVGRARELAIALRMVAVGLGTRAHVFHAHDLNTLAAASWAARLGRARLVYDAHEIAPGQENVPHPERVQAEEAKLIRRADAVIHTTPMRARWAADTYGVPMPVVLPNLPDIAATVEPADVREALGLPRDADAIVHAGGIQPNRGLEALVRALALLPERFALAFVGYGRLRPALEKLVAELGLAGRVGFTGPVSHEQLLRYTASAWCGTSLLVDTCANHRWSLPNKLFECLALGIPVVVSDNPEISAYAQGLGAGEVASPTDPAAIAEAVRRLDAGYTEARAAAQRAAEEHRWPVAAPVLLGLYERVLGRSGARVEAA